MAQLPCHSQVSGIWRGSRIALTCPHSLLSPALSRGRHAPSGGLPGGGGIWAWALGEEEGRAGALLLPEVPTCSSSAGCEDTSEGSGGSGGQ